MEDVLKMGKNKVILSVAGSEFIVETEESREYALNLCSTVDLKIRQKLQSSAKMTLPTAAILTALDICDENEKNKSHADRLRNEIKSYLEQVSDLNYKLNQLEKENVSLKRDLENLTTPKERY